MTISSAAERIIIYAVVAAVIFFGYQGVFGQDGALNLIREQNRTAKMQTELIINHMETIRAQQQELRDSIKEVREQQEAIRQHIGTVAREEYHPTMKKIKEQDADEQIEEIHRYNDSLGLSD